MCSSCYAQVFLMKCPNAQELAFVLDVWQFAYQGGGAMSTEAEDYRARANECEELEMSTASLRVFSESVWPLTVLCIAILATLAWSAFLAWNLSRLAVQLI